MTWTDERVELLKKLWSDGLSASQIAAELGGITRNAVIGKVHRLGLSGRAKSPSSSAPRARKPRSPHDARGPSRHARQHRARAGLSTMEQEPEPELIDNIIPIGQRRTLLELTEATCHWPIGDPATRRVLLLRRPAAHRPALLQPITRASPISRRPNAARTAGRSRLNAPFQHGSFMRRCVLRPCTTGPDQAAERPKRSSSA